MFENKVKQSMLTNSVSRDTLFFIKEFICMNQFVNQFQRNHIEMVEDLLAFYDVTLEELNWMLARSFTAIAGGYARRLHMIQQGYEMTPQDISSYYSSDMDVFTISSYMKDLNTGSDTDEFFIAPSSVVGGTIGPDLDAVFETPVSVSLNDDMVQEVKKSEVPVSGLGNDTYEGYNPNYALQTKDFILDTRNRTTTVMSLNRKSGNVPNCPAIQLVNASARRIKTSNKELVDPLKPCKHTQTMVQNFDLSCAMYYVSKISHKVEDCEVHYIGKPVDNPYHTFINPQYIDTVTVAGRLVKYSELGFAFSEEDLSRAIKGNKKVVAINEHLGGYTDDDVY